MNHPAPKSILSAIAGCEASRWRHPLWFPVAGLLLSGCATSDELAPSPPAVASSAIATEGRRIFLTCAGSCHAPEPVLKYTRVEWLNKHVPAMAGEAKLTAAQRAALEAYLTACCPAG